MSKFLIIIYMFISTLCCASVPKISYEHDITFPSSLMGNRAEFPVFIGKPGRICTDMEGNYGGCYKNLLRGVSLRFRIPPQGYDYRIEIQCSGSVFTDTFTVLAAEMFHLNIGPGNFHDVSKFTCRGTVLPEGRSAESGAMWEVRVLVHSKEYKKKEVIIEKDNHIWLGKHSYQSLMFDGKGWTKWDKNIASNYKPAKFCIVSQTYMMRFSYLCKGMTWDQLYEGDALPMPGEDF